jgi:hypothetical protein
MNSNFISRFFEPLPKGWCNYFYYFSVFFFIVFVSSLASMIVNMVIKFKQINIYTILNWSIILLNSFVGYLVNRIFYSMCIKSL